MVDQPHSGPSRERWMQIEQLFTAALAQPPAARDRWLAGACEDAEVRATVARLLAADSADGTLDHVVTDVARALLGVNSPDPSSMPAAGIRVGAWRIVEEIGRGGMGVVFLVERADGAYRQQAALKLVSGFGAGTALQRRFLREREILARLEHPGIARLLDGGFTGEGTPYLVMERIEGVPITRYAARHALTIRDRVALLLQVCEAVTYAHGRLIAHCDLKPTNMLVTSDGRVRLLDFGIARLLDPLEEGSEIQTRTALFALTPEYAAPEQLRGEPVGTAADLYTLGAVLYELLCGHRPFDLKSRALPEVLQLLDREPVPISQLPGLDRGLRRQLEGDLETIIAKAMNKEPARRYASIEAFAADLRRYLEGRPVLARPATPGYRLGRYLLRHRLGLAATAIVVMTLLAGIAGTWWQSRVARFEAARAQAVAGFLFELFDSANPERTRGREITARQLVEEGAARLGALPEGSELRIEVAITLGRLYTVLGEYEQAEALLNPAVAEAREYLGADAPLTAQALTALATTLLEAGRYAEAEIPARESLARRQAGVDREHTDRSLLLLAELLRHQGRTAEAEARFREALGWARKQHGDSSLEAASVLQNMALLLEEVERFDEAERAGREALAIRRKRRGADHPDVGRTLGLLAAIRGSQNDLLGAERLHREELALMRRTYRGDHPGIAAALDQVAVYVDRQGRYPEAEALYNEALAMRERVLGPGHPDVASTINNLATLYYHTGELARAAEAQQRALDIWRAAFGEEHWKVATASNNLGVMLCELGRLDEAEPLLVDALAMRRRILGNGHSDVGASLNNLANLQRIKGDLAGAEENYRAALANFGASLPPDHWRVGDAAHGLGLTLAAMGRTAEARAMLAEALEIRRGSFIASDSRTLATEQALAALENRDQAR